MALKKSIEKEGNKETMTMMYSIDSGFEDEEETVHAYSDCNRAMLKENENALIKYRMD